MEMQMCVHSDKEGKREEGPISERQKKKKRKEKRKKRKENRRQEVPERWDLSMTQTGRQIGQQKHAEQLTRDTCANQIQVIPC
jgi:hypothetical protein